MSASTLKKHPKTLVSLAIALSLSPSLCAADFTIVDGQTVTTAQFLAANETGTIEAGGQLNTSASLGINATGANTTVNNAGSISTTGNIHVGIQSLGGNVTINNSGALSTTGNASFGVYSLGSNASITNSGTLSTAGPNARGIHSDGTNATISNSGSISTAGNNAFGIYSTSANSTINNSGNISTTGSTSQGIYSTSTNATISNSGSISTAGNNARGIRARGFNAIISNSGSITTTGDTAFGIESDFSNATISNSGSITTTGIDAYGITSTDADASISNSGSISTTGDSAYGIIFNGSNAIISNSGSISTTNEFAHGVFSSGHNATISNSGSITTTGANAVGIRHQLGVNATINNSGSIISTGAGSFGIYSSQPAANTTINNSGLISATGANSLAIKGLNNDITLNLLSGSQIIGRIDLGDNSDLDTVNVYGGGASANLTFENTEVINLFGTGVVSGNKVITVDPTGESTRSVALSGLTSSIHGVLSRRMAQTTPLKPIQVASLSLSPGMLFQQRKPVAWAQIFGGNADRDADNNALAYDMDHIGFTLGYEWDLNKTRVGLLGGVVHSSTETETSSFATEADSYYVGGYGHFNLGSVNLTASLLGGYSDNENDRLVIDNINGREVAKADFNSFFISPSLTLSSAYSLADRLELRPSASVNYSIAWLDSYREKGTTSSNLKIDDRTLKVFTAKVQLATAYQLDQNSELEFRVGVSSRNSDDDDTDVSIAGNSFSYANAGDENVSGGFAGVNLRVAAQDNLSLMVDIEMGGDSDEDYVNGQISLDYSF